MSGVERQMAEEEELALTIRGAEIIGNTLACKKLSAIKTAGSSHAAASIEPLFALHHQPKLKKGVPALEAEVRHLEDLMPRLQEEKAILLRRINNAQEKTRHLPFEVLSNIFQFARPPIDFTAYEPIHYYIDDPDFPLLTGYVDPAENFHHTLAAVSHHWRQVALSTPQLWTSISLRILNTFTDFNTSLLDLHFKNAHNLPISIRLDLTNPAIAWTAHEGSKRDAFLTHLDPLEATIFNQNADKIKSLVFIEPPIEWFFFDRSNLSRCTSVTIYWPSARDNSVFNFEDLPCLQHVKLVDSDTLFELPTTITDLQLAGTDLTHSMEAIAELPNLVKFETTGTTTRFIKPAVLHLLGRL
ncbi:hypothetical protein AGABI2DRAFT_120802 [Agaricus bisporus var. bisporus H97]|uniref:hypothetical protein n=1 Tax=Agaricus bisporus var. bisporus (strain H97 / ATCC MYA-4626 / FGSC 10389) TaxID=936046 RepID=UPI00029F7999|nr:hypothetical protein AGABI2DRAFT_120802 [Agaricus bisporus var. bisporus H97]EKV44677.1 hypothetical protein AGABI2DRAFT_120802 [Agaricus bisporus var. bisporus H97]